MKKITIKIKDLFRYLNLDNETNLDTIIPWNDKSSSILIETIHGELTPILGFVKKPKQSIFKYTLSSGRELSCSPKHLVLNDKGVIHIHKAKQVRLKDFSLDKIEKIDFLRRDYVYDISISSPHLYVTPNGIIHHNTALAKILAKKFSPNSYMYINASEESGIDIVRSKISNFISVQSFDGNPKVVILDEADGISIIAQQALKGIMEEYLNDVKFILTSNSKHKLLEALQSRCQTFEFPVPIKQVWGLISSILSSEGITLTEDDRKSVILLLKTHFPDIRKTVNELQKCCVTGTYIPNNKKEETISSTIVEKLKDKVLVWEIRKYILSHENEFNNDYQFLMRKLFDHYVKACDTPKVLLIVDSMYRDAIVTDPEVNFTGLLINLSKS